MARRRPGARLPRGARWGLGSPPGFRQVTSFRIQHLVTKPFQEGFHRPNRYVVFGLIRATCAKNWALPTIQGQDELAHPGPYVDGGAHV